MEIAPVVLILFRRPDFVARQMEVLARVKPRKLFIVADGPRNSVDASLCEAAREAIAGITWDCDVRRDYAASNLGTYRRIVSGLSWVFEQVEEAIVLEDDVIPETGFFGFATEMLDRYRYETDVFTVTGFSLAPYLGMTGTSYAFSRYPLTWGWATWRRAWRTYDGSLRSWPRLRQTRILEDLLKDPHAIDFYRLVFDAAYAALRPGYYEIRGWGPVVAWDFQWVYACLMHEARCIVPSSSIVQNLGFREDGTHFRDSASHLANLESHTMRFPLIHPSGGSVSVENDAQLFYNWMRWRRLTRWQRLRFRIACAPVVQSARRLMTRRQGNAA